MTSPETLELEAVDDALAGRYVAPEHAELAELALLLRDDRPEPVPAWATHLDRRVEARFPSRPRERKFRVWLRNVSPALGLAACVLLVIGLVSVSPGGDDSDEGGGSSGSSGSIATEEAPSGDAAGGTDADAPVLQDSAGRAKGGDPSSDRRDNRAQQLSASLTLAAPRREIDEVATQVGEVASNLGGFVQSSSVSSQEGGALDLRVPSDRLEQAIQRISRLGRVRELPRRSVDITANVVSARERLADARAERKSLLEQLANAVTVNETESIRARLEIVSREISRARRSLQPRQQRGQLRQRRGPARPAGGQRRRRGRLDAGRRARRRDAGARGRRRRARHRVGRAAALRADLAARVGCPPHGDPPPARARPRHGLTYPAGDDARER